LLLLLLFLLLALLTSYTTTPTFTMLSTPESDIPIPLSESDEKKDALEQMRDSQEASTVFDHSFFLAGIFTQEELNTSWVHISDDDDDTVDGHVQKQNNWIECSPQRRGKIKSTPGRTDTTADTTNDEDLDVNMPVVKEDENEIASTTGKSMENGVSAANPVTPESNTKGAATTDVKKKDLSTCDNDSLDVVDTADADAAAGGGTTYAAVNTSANTSAFKTTPTDESPTRAVQKNLKKKAFRWFRKRRKEENNGNVVVMKEDVVMQPSASVETTAKEVTKQDIFRTMRQDSGATKTEESTTTTVESDYANKDTAVPHVSVKKDIVGVLGNDSVIAHVASADSTDTPHASVKKDIIGVVQDGKVIAHVASQDSTDTHVSVKKDIIGVVQDGKVIAHVASTDSPDKSIAGNVASTMNNAATLGDKRIEETGGASAVEAAKEKILSNDTDNTDAGATSNNWTDFDGTNEIKQDESLKALASDSKPILTTPVLFNDCENVQPTNDTADYSAKDDTQSPTEDKERESPVVVVVADAGNAAVASTATISKDTKDKSAPTSSSIHSIFRRLGSPKRKAVKKGAGEAKVVASVKAGPTKETAFVKVSNGTVVEHDAVPPKATRNDESMTDWTGFSGANAFKADCAADDTIVVASAAVSSPSDATEKVQPIEESTMKALTEAIEKEDGDGKVAAGAAAGAGAAAAAAAAVAVGAVATVAATTKSVRDADAQKSVIATKSGLDADADAQKSLKEEASLSFDLRRSNSEKGLPKGAVDAAEIGHAHATDNGVVDGDASEASDIQTDGNKALVDTGNAVTVKEDAAKASDWTDFDDANNMDKERGDVDPAAADSAAAAADDDDAAAAATATATATAVGIGTAGDSSEVSDIQTIGNKALVDTGNAVTIKEGAAKASDWTDVDDANNVDKERGDGDSAAADSATTAAADAAGSVVGIGTVATGVVQVVPEKNKETQQALKKKASRWFGLRRSHSEKALDKDAGDIADAAHKTSADRGIDTTNGNVANASDWHADFDGINVFKADRASHDALIAAAAVPLPPDGQEELRTSEDMAKTSFPPGDEQAAPAVAGAAAVGVAMGDDENVPPPSGEDGIVEYFDEESQQTSMKGGLRNRCKCTRRLKIILIVLAHLAAIGAVLGVVLPMVLSRGSVELDVGAAPSPTKVPMPMSSSSPNASPTAATTGETLEPTISPTVEPTPAPVQQPLDVMLSSVSFDGGAALRTRFSAQFGAYNWLKNNTFLDTYSDEKRIQRYSLATFYYSSAGDTWDNKTGWLSDEDECSWFNTAFGGFCSDDGAVVELDIMANGMGGTLPEEIALLPLSMCSSCALTTCFHCIVSHFVFELLYFYRGSKSS